MKNTMFKSEPSPSILFRREVRFHPSLTFGEKVFLAEIEDMTMRGRIPFESRSSLARMFGVSNPTIANWLEKLTKLGLVDVQTDKECKKFLVAK